MYKYNLIEWRSTMSNCKHCQEIRKNAIKIIKQSAKSLSDAIKYLKENKYGKQ